jgi:two-component system phosphate regulon response regulator OmpR
MGDAVFDLKRQELRAHGLRVHLTTAELQLLTILAKAPGEPFSRDALADAAGITGNPRTVDVQVTRLRKKIETDPRQPRYLQTLRGKGYVLRPG